VSFEDLYTDEIFAQFSLLNSHFPSVAVCNVGVYYPGLFTTKTRRHGEDRKINGNRLSNPEAIIDIPSRPASDMYSHNIFSP